MTCHWDCGWCPSSTFRFSDFLNLCNKSGNLCTGEGHGSACPLSWASSAPIMASPGWPSAYFTPSHWDIDCCLIWAPPTRVRTWCPYQVVGSDLHNCLWPTTEVWSSTLLDLANFPLPLPLVFTPLYNQAVANSIQSISPLQSCSDGIQQGYPDQGKRLRGNCWLREKMDEFRGQMLSSLQLWNSKTSFVIRF